MSDQVRDALADIYKFLLDRQRAERLRREMVPPADRWDDDPPPGADPWLADARDGAADD